MPRKPVEPAEAVNPEAVEPETDVEPPPKTMTLLEAIESGSYLEILRAQRREVVAALPTVAGAPLAALHRQLSLLSKEIAGLEAGDADDTEGGADVEDEEFDPASV